MKSIRIFGAIMSLLFIFAFADTASARSHAVPEIAIDECRYTHIERIAVSLSISNSTAKATGKITPHSNYRTKVMVQLQCCKDGKWTTISTWTGSCNAGTSRAGGEKSVSKGYDYRVKVTGYVYDKDGSLVEKATKYSSTKTY